MCSFLYQSSLLQHKGFLLGVKSPPPLDKRTVFFSLSLFSFPLSGLSAYLRAGGPRNITIIVEDPIAGLGASPPPFCVSPPPASAPLWPTCLVQNLLFHSGVKSSLANLVLLWCLDLSVKWHQYFAWCFLPMTSKCFIQSPNWFWEAEPRLVNPVCPKMKQRPAVCLRYHDESVAEFFL